MESNVKIIVEVNGECIGICGVEDGVVKSLEQVQRDDVDQTIGVVVCVKMREHNDVAIFIVKHAAAV